MSTRHFFVFLFAAAATWVVPGCGVQPETLATLTEAVRTAQDHARTLQPPPSVIAAPSKSEFKPAHPNRVDPFVFPSEITDNQRAPVPTTSVAQVRVMGFAEVDELRVLLEAKDSTQSLKVGDELNGIEVVAIKPPTVELRLGNLIWTASMFDGALTQ